MNPTEPDIDEHGNCLTCGRYGSPSEGSCACPQKPRTKIEIITTPEGAARIQALTEVAGLKVLSVEPAKEPGST